MITSPDWDVIVVGGGPAGLSAAVAAARRVDAKILICEREEVLGGIPRHCVHAGFGIRDLKWNYSGPSYARKLEEMVRATKSEIRTETSVTRVEAQDGSHVVHTVSPRGLQCFSTRTVVLATGCHESTRHARLLPGQRPLGIFSTGALQQFVHLKHIKPGKRAVVLGSEHVSFSAVLTLQKAGVDVAALVEADPYPHSFLPVSWLFQQWFRFPLLLHHQIVDIQGEGRLTGVVVEDLFNGKRQEIACDTLIVSGKFVPEISLAVNSGIAIDQATGGVLADSFLQTSRRGVFACGNVLHGAETADIAALEGKWVGERVAHYLESRSWLTQRLRIQCESPIAWIAPGNLLYPVVRFPRFLYTMRTQYRVHHAVVTARFHGAIIWQKRLGTLTPDRRIHIPVQNWKLNGPVGPQDFIELSID